MNDDLDIKDIKTPTNRIYEGQETRKKNRSLAEIFKVDTIVNHRSDWYILTSTADVRGNWKKDAHLLLQTQRKGDSRHLLQDTEVPCLTMV